MTEIPAALDLEYRSTPGLNLEPGDATGMFKSVGRLCGYAARFDADSQPLSHPNGDFVETIAPGAFSRTLRESPAVLALWSHDESRPLGRAPHGMTVEEDEEGLRTEISLPDTSTARDLLALVRAKIINAMSFGFRVRRDKWSTANGYRRRTLLDVDLLEISAVTCPAYSQTSLDARSRRAPTAGAGDLLEAERKLHELRFGLPNKSVTMSNLASAEHDLQTLRFGLPRITP